MKKLMSMLLVTVLLCGCMMPVAYADSAIQPRDSNYFSSYGTTLSNEGEGVIKITFSTTGIKINNSIGVSSYLVEKLNDDGNWEDVTGLLSGETGSGVMSYTYSKYFNGVVGETYRVQVTFICVRSDGTETKTYTSGRITAKKYV